MTEKAGMEGWAVMDRGWEDVQLRTFTNWMNSNLRKKGAEIGDLVADLGQDNYLHLLINCLYETPLKKFKKGAKLRMQKIDNMVNALAMIKEAGIQNKGCSAENLVDGDKKLILGLVWVIILHYQISGISVDEMTAKEGLLLWCQRVTKPYADDGVKVDNFTTSWTTGLALAALVHAHRPDLMDWEEIKGMEPKARVEKTMEIAEEKCGIPRLLDAGDLTDVPRPDERSVMTQISEYFHAFASLSKAKTAGRRVGRFVDIIKSIKEMIAEYERRATELTGWVDTTVAEHNERDFSEEFEAAVGLLSSVKEWKKTDRRAHFAEKGEIESLFSNIQTKLKANKRPEYVPPEGLDSFSISGKFDELDAATRDRLAALREHMKAMKDRVAHEYADIAEGLHSQIAEISDALPAIEGELTDQKAAAEALKEQVEALSLDDLVAKQGVCDAAGVESSEYTDYLVDDIEYELELCTKSIQKKITFIENQIALSEMSNITPEQMEEFEVTFRHFDKDSSNSLDKLEFAACLSGQGEAMTDEELDELWKTISADGSVITFEEYVQYMVKSQEDSGSEEQIRESFAVLAGGKDFITRQDLAVGGLDDECIDVLLGEMTATGEDQYDFQQYLDSCFN